MSQQPETKYSVVDLFAGAGGLSYGFLQTGRFDVKAAFENNQYAQETYMANHQGTGVYDDVSLALTNDIKDAIGPVDVVIGGPPCQGFSSANRQKNHAVSQNNSLVKKYVKAVLHLDPRAFIMENVSMLQSDTHLFYVSQEDRADIEKYGIKTVKCQISLMEQDFVFTEAAGIVSDLTAIERFLWEEKEYLTLNIIYKKRNNKSKLAAALEKYRSKLLALANRLLENRDDQHPIRQADHRAGEALLAWLALEAQAPEPDDLRNAIELSIMIQRMLGKAKEIHDNDIVVDSFSADSGLAANVTAMAVVDYIESILGAVYSIKMGVLSAAAFGAPQKRMRFVVLGVKKDIVSSVELPEGIFAEENFRTVKDAISDLEPFSVRLTMGDDEIGIELPEAPDTISELGKMLRNASSLKNHISTATTEEALERFRLIKQGENFHSLPEHKKKSYSDTKRTQNTIYLRLRYDEPSGTVVNVRKSMWIHPVLDRALSIREAARLQTFPDSFVICGTKDAQYQQVGNAVPPILARALAEHLCGYLDKDAAHG